MSPVDMRVAVAVAFAPTGTAAGKVAENVACPAPFVVTVVEPRNRAPSPKPEESHTGLVKNSSVKRLVGEESSVPWTVTVEPVVAAD